MMNAIIDAASETVVINCVDHLGVIFEAGGVRLSFPDAAHRRAYLRQLEAMLREWLSLGATPCSDCTAPWGAVATGDTNRTRRPSW